MKSEDIKKTFKNIFDKCVDVVLEHKRYFLGGVVFVAMMIVLFGFVANDNSADSSTSGVYQAYKTNNNEELSTLITTYYTSYADGDTDTLQTIATPISDQEISYIQFYSDYIESFNDIEIYTKPGLTDGSYLVSTIVNLEYVDIDTEAPGMEFFYVETNEDGALYINNLYCNFNQKNNIYEMDSDVADLIALFVRQGDVLAKEAEVQAAYDEAVESDEALSTFISETLKSAVVQWNLDYQEQVEAAEAAAAEAEAQAAQEAEEAAAAEAEAEEEANSYTGTTNAKANVRAEASADSDKLGSLESGVSITIYGEEGDFYKFDYNGTKAYITQSAVTLDSDSDDSSDNTDTEEETTTTESLEAGTVVTLTSTVNIRSGMDSSSSKVAVAYEGETVEVVMSYAEGWTKVKYGKKEGYVRTDLLTD